MKKHKYNVREMDDTFMESINRDSAILSIPGVPGLPHASNVPVSNVAVSNVAVSNVLELPHVVQSNNGSLRFSDEIKGGV